MVPLAFFQAGERYMFRVLDQAGIYILLALGLNIVVGYAGLLDLGYVAFYAIGAYSYALLASPQLGLHVPFWLVLPVAPLLAALARRAARCADPSAPRRLPGDRDARVRGGHPHPPEQPGRRSRTARAA